MAATNILFTGLVLLNIVKQDGAIKYVDVLLMESGGHSAEWGETLKPTLSHLEFLDRSDEKPTSFHIGTEGYQDFSLNTGSGEPVVSATGLYDIEGVARLTDVDAEVSLRKECAGNDALYACKRPVWWIMPDRKLIKARVRVTGNWRVSAVEVNTCHQPIQGLDPSTYGLELVRQGVVGSDSLDQGLYDEALASAVLFSTDDTATLKRKSSEGEVPVDILVSALPQACTAVGGAPGCRLAVFVNHPNEDPNPSRFSSDTDKYSDLIYRFLDTKGMSRATLFGRNRNKGFYDNYERCYGISQATNPPRWKCPPVTFVGLN